MSSPKPNRSGTSSSFSRVPGRSMSFNGRTTDAILTAEKLRRPKTVPDLKSSMRNAVVSAPVREDDMRKKLTKVLLNVTVQGSVGAVQVLISPESTVRDLISAAVKHYVKEGRRPALSPAIFDDFNLHYSQFTLQSLDREEKIVALGSRNFFLCKRRKEAAETTSSCSEQAAKLGFPWLKFMSFLF